MTEDKRIGGITSTVGMGYGEWLGAVEEASRPLPPTPLCVLAKKMGEEGNGSERKGLERNGRARHISFSDFSPAPAADRPGLVERPKKPSMIDLL